MPHAQHLCIILWPSRNIVRHTIDARYLTKELDDWEVYNPTGIWAGGVVALGCSLPVPSLRFNHGQGTADSRH